MDETDLFIPKNIIKRSANKQIIPIHCPLGSNAQHLIKHPFSNCLVTKTCLMTKKNQLNENPIRFIYTCITTGVQVL